MKDETQGIPISEFCGLRSKCYSILLDDKLEVKKQICNRKTSLERNQEILCRKTYTSQKLY